MSRTIDTESKKRYAIAALKWCESYFGLCDRKKRKPLFRFSERKRKSDNFDIFGNYCFYRNEIIIYLLIRTNVFMRVCTATVTITNFKIIIMSEGQRLDELNFLRVCPN